VPQRSRAAADRQSAEPLVSAVLLVEDSPYLATTMQMMLERLGYAVRHVVNARLALDIIEAGEPIDLVFSDIVMPGEINGIKLAQILRERFPSLPIVLTTGFSNAARDAQLKGFRLLEKPYPIEALDRALRDALSDG